MHEAEFDFLKDPVKNGADKFKQYGLPIITSKVTPEKLNEGSAEIEGFKFNVLHTPGHSPGSLTYVFDELQLLEIHYLIMELDVQIYIKVIMKLS